MRKEFKFLFIFLVIASFLYILVSLLYSKDLPIIGTFNVASTSSEILNRIGTRTILINGDTIYLPNNNSLKVILECAGVYEMIILVSIMLAYPTGLKNKFYGSILGIIVIYILNMLRLVSISYILAYYTDKFNFIDRYLWQISLIIFISLVYMLWLKLIERSNSSSV